MEQQMNVASRANVAAQAVNAKQQAFATVEKIANVRIAPVKRTEF